MALTKTISYVQNTPISLGFNNEISGTVGEVVATITWDNWGGFVPNVVIGTKSSSSITTECSASALPNTWIATGTEAEVNSMLNQARWFPAAYTTPNLTQDLRSLDRQMGDFKGELLVEVKNVPIIALGDIYRFRTDGVKSGDYKVTAIEPSKSQFRVYGVPVDSTPYTLTTPYSTELLNSSDLKIANIVDCAIINPHGQYLINISISDSSGIVATGTITLIGRLFVKEPFFTVLPTNSIAIPDNVFTQIPLGEIAQEDGDFVTVQALLKRSENDPEFSPDGGNVAISKPAYISVDRTLGCFSSVRVGDRVSEQPIDGFVWWQFFGSPEQCNKALNSVAFKRAADEGDLIIETRIVNTRNRIYHSRGLN